MKDIYLDSFIIRDILPDHTYHIKNNAFPEKEITISFQGDVDSFSFIDFSTGLYGLKNDTYGLISLKDNFFVSENSIIKRHFDLDAFPIVIFSAKTLELYNVQRIDCVFDKEYAKYTIIGNKLPSSLVTHGDILQKECQELVPTIPIVTSDYPIFRDDNRPTLDVLKNIYQTFIEYNDDEKIADQYLKSSARCHMRAHFVNLLLNRYGIPSLKIYKFWDPSEWQGFNDNKAWSYHCATMVIDSDNNKWIWDPWVGNNKSLLSLNQWLYRDGEPQPKRCMITNPQFIFSFSNTIVDDASYLMKFCSNKQYQILQLLMTEAIPNPISKSECMLSSSDDYKKNGTAMFFGHPSSERPTENRQQAGNDFGFKRGFLIGRS